MFEEHLETITQHILPASVRSLDETMFRAFTMTCKMIAAAEASGCQAVTFLKTEARRLCELYISFR